MYESVQTLGWIILFMVAGSSVGIALVVAASALVPKILNRLSTKIDEETEIAEGNLAVATYFGKIVSAVVVAISIVVAAALLGGVLLIIR